MIYIINVSFIEDNTRQLPIGAGYGPWGGYTDRIVCNIPKFKDLGPTVLAGEGVSHGQISVEYNVDDEYPFDL